MRVWKIDHLQFSESDSPLTKILSPKNVVLLSQPSDNKIWITVGRFLKKLLNENILSIDLLNEQAVALFKDEWPIVSRFFLNLFSIVYNMCGCYGMNLI